MRWLQLFALTVLVAHAQTNPPRLEFEVASVKPTPPGGRGGMIKAQPGGRQYTAQGAPVKLMISLMYKIPLRQIEGGPDWINTDGFDIEAKADHSYNLDDLHTMFQNLLADRFHLKFHRETREGPVYILSVDKSGSKMKVNTSAQDFNIPIAGSKDGTTIGTRVPMPYFAWWLGQILQREERPVIDKTGLTGFYDFTLAFLPELPPDFNKDNLPPGVADRPSLVDALREQLGLKLQPQKGPVEFFIIDHVEKPEGN